ncbi:uncharacterized protein LOC144680682 isoform X3 [Cetorhinus maximus]
MEDHYEDEPVSKFSGSLFDTEEGFHRNRHVRAFLRDNQRQAKPSNASGSSKQQICKLANDAGGECRCPERNEGQGTLFISTGFKGTWTKLNITVRSQMGSLGISIAGGKGSTPYKINNEGIFISKVSKGGPADLAGVQVGDMVLEVNGISLQNVTHHEAVNALKNSGTVIKILILRDRALTIDDTVIPSVNSGEADTIRPHQTERPCFITQPAASSEQPESGNIFLEGKMTTTCNGTSTESVTSKNHTVNPASEMLQKSTLFRIVHHPMPDPIIYKKRAQQCSAMKSAVHVNETAKPLAFTFVPTVRRLPVHIQVIDTTRSSPQPGKQQKPEANSSIMNEPLHITEEMPATDVRMADTIGGGTPRRHMEIGQSWLNKEREYVPAEEAAPLQGIFKAELVFLADSYGSDSDCLSRGTEAEVNLSAKTLPLLSLSPNTFADDKSSSIRAKEVVGESKAPLLQDAEQKVDEALQEPFFQAIDEAISDSEESAAANTSEKTHSQFLFESESLRQQSEELYATIEQLLEDPLPTCCSSSAPKSLQKPQDSKAHKHVSPTPKSAGRETKYANLHLSVPESTENRPTRPGVIRPVANVQKTPATPKMEESGLNPFRQCLEETSDTEIKEPRHSIMTIHENEALAINELTHVTTKLNRDQHQSQGRRRESERSLLPNTDSNQEVLMILEEELEQAVKT